MRMKSLRVENIQKGFFVLFAVALVIAIGFGVTQYTVPGSYSSCVVTDKDRVSTSDGDSDMRVYTDNCGVLSVGDNIVHGVFNASDIYSGIKVGSTYDFKTTGFRIPILSMFPIIYNVSEKNNTSEG